MMKRIIVCMLALALAVIGMTSVFAASAEDSLAPQGKNAEVGAAYSVVSAVVNRTYDFKEDFHDSYLYDDDFRTEGIFRLDDYNGDVTLTLKNNSTGEQFVYERNDQTEWSVKATVDHLLYETAQLDASVCIYDLGGDYGIRDTEIPVAITVVSSQYSADFHKYPNYDISYYSVTEGEDFTLDYDASSPGGKATVKFTKKPWLFFLSLYNAETGETEYYSPDDSEFVFPTEVEVEDFDPSCDSFWFFFPGKLIMEDGYEFEFTMSALGIRSVKATENPSGKPDNPDATEGAGTISPKEDHARGRATKDSATPDSSKASTKSSDSVKQSSDPVKTGDSPAAAILALSLLIVAAFSAMYIAKRRNTL